MNRKYAGSFHLKPGAVFTNKDQAERKISSRSGADFTKGLSQRKDQLSQKF